MPPLEISAMNERRAPDKQIAAASYVFQAAISMHNRFQKLHLAILCTSFIWLICQHAIFQLGQRAFSSEQRECNESLYDHLQAFESPTSVTSLQITFHWHH